MNARTDQFRLFKERTPQIVDGHQVVQPASVSVLRDALWNPRSQVEVDPLVQLITKALLLENLAGTHPVEIVEPMAG
ncbi:hypothetical protein D3C85_1335820 [compost metagenome]